MKNIWILTEERPKANVIKTILEKFALEKKNKYNTSQKRLVITD